MPQSSAGMSNQQVNMCNVTQNKQTFTLPGKQMTVYSADECFQQGVIQLNPDDESVVAIMDMIMARELTWQVNNSTKALFL
jgi:hypothetical protein